MTDRGQNTVCFNSQLQEFMAIFFISTKQTILEPGEDFLKIYLVRSCLQTKHRRSPITLALSPSARYLTPKQYLCLLKSTESSSEIFVNLSVQRPINV